jgi:UDP-GlcNAc:undecaprenyl-phosphate GlcNAc-1-phosphate transferase
MIFEFNLSFFIIFSLVSFFSTFLIAKYSRKFFSGSLLDKDFLKPQAFHKEPIGRIGGIAIISLFSLFILFYFLIFDIFLKDYFIITLTLFILGFLDDLKIEISPNTRLVLMLVLLIFCINFFSIQITKSGLEFLNLWLENIIFQTCFVLLCFLFIINGANLVDGFNGLLTIHFLLINSIFLAINLSNQNQDFSIILIAQTIIILSFLLFNFPKAKIFLGDSGSYLLGALIALNTIKTYELNLNISPFFYASILFYLFQFLKKTKKISNANYKTGLLINIAYFILIIPTIYFKENGIFCRYYFFSQIFIYTVCYYYLSNLKKNENI